MRYSTSLCLYGLTGAAVLAAGLSVAAGADARDPVGLLRLARQMLQESRRSEVMRVRQAASARSLEIKRAAVVEMLAGRLTLREAAAEFRYADERVEEVGPGLLPCPIRETSEQEYCRRVLNWLRAWIEVHPESKERVARLRDEYRRAFGEPAQRR